MSSKILSWDKQSAAEGTLYPVSREGHSLTYIPGKGILMFGGLGANLFSDLFFYDPAEHHWTLAKITGRYPSPRCYHQAFYFDPFFVVYAGQGDRGRSLGDMYILNIKDDKCQWKRVVASKPPESRHQLSLVGDDSIKDSPLRYMFGGINTPNNTFFNDLWQFDFSGGIMYDQSNAEVSGIKFNQLQTAGKKPMERKGHCSFIYNKRLFVYGGQTADINIDTMREIHMVDLEKLVWSSLENKSADISPRSLFSCCWYNDHTLILFGGLENRTMEGLNELMFLELKDMHFSFPFTAGQYPEARYGHSVCNFDQQGRQQLFLVGGMNREFCNMDIFTLTQIQRKDNQRWEKIVQKTPLEEAVSKKASNIIYQMRKRKVELYDQMIEEKTLG